MLVAIQEKKELREAILRQLKARDFEGTLVKTNNDIE